MSGGSSFVFWICLFVGCTALPMSIDLLRVFLPRKFLSGRLVEAWQRPLRLKVRVGCEGMREEGGRNGRGQAIVGPWLRRAVHYINN